MIKNKKILGIAALLLPLMLVGCSNDSEQDDVEVQKESSVDENVENASNNKEDKPGEIKIRGRKVTYENLALRYPNEWQRVEAEDMLLYKIDDNNGNLSLVIDDTNGASLEEYVLKAKNLLGESIDLNDVSIEDATFGKYEAKTIQYKYDFEGNIVDIYQVCFVEEGKAYIFTLGSGDEKLEENKEKLKTILEDVKFKK